MTTDKERILRLEAENAELRDEVAAWREHDRVRRYGGDVVQQTRLHVVKSVFRNNGAGGNGIGWAAKMLLLMLDHPGQVFGRDTLLDVIALSEDANIKCVDVAAVHLRKGLESIGHRAALQTVWGVGYRLDADAAPAIAEALGLTKANVDPDALERALGREAAA